MTMTWLTFEELKNYIIDNNIVGQEIDNLVQEAQQKGLTIDVMWVLDYVRKAEVKPKVFTEKTYATVLQEIKSIMPKEVSELPFSLSVVNALINQIAKEYNIEIPVYELQSKGFNDGLLFQSLGLLASSVFKGRKGKTNFESQWYHEFWTKRMEDKVLSDLDLDLTSDQSDDELDDDIFDIVEKEEIEKQNELKTQVLSSLG